MTASLAIVYAFVLFAVPSKELPVEVTSPVAVPIVRGVARAVAVAAFPVVDPELPDTLPVTFPVRGPTNPVADRTSVDALKVNPDADLAHKLPVAAVTKRGKQVVSADSSATVIFVAVVAVVAVVALPDKAPVNVVHHKLAVDALKVRLAFVLCGRFPVAAVTNVGKHVVSLASFATAVLFGVIAALPSKATPPILRGVASVVAVVAFPVNAQVKVVAVRAFVLELYVNPVFVFGHRLPVAAVKKAGKQVVSDASFATVISVGVPQVGASSAREPSA